MSTPAPHHPPVPDPPPNLPRISVVIPAFNEQRSIRAVLGDLPWPWLHEVVVVDNGCTDDTAAQARAGGARVVAEARRGYGSACLRGIAALEPPDVVVFVDADYSDFPEELIAIVTPILRDEADLVIGSRLLGDREPGALLPQARWGNLLAVTLIRWLYGHQYTDLGPFRAIQWDALTHIGMADTNFGWTVEMQVKALQAGLRVAEVPVRYRRRIGVSKITGTVRGTLAAGWKILFTIARYAVLRGPGVVSPYHRGPTAARPPSGGFPPTGPPDGGCRTV